MEFAEKLKELRLKKGVSQTVLAEEIHISRSAVAKWENGLGLPNQQSLELLAEYFSVTPDELVPDSEEAESVSGKLRLSQQSKALIGFCLGALIGLFLLGFIFIPPLRGSLELWGLGLIITAFGIFNLSGNIASIHWYNRRKVSAENRKPYCRLVGLGTIIIGLGLIAAGVLQAFVGEQSAEAVTTAGIVLGLILILCAQFKYNKGLF